MTTKLHKHVIGAAAALAFVVAPLGCGEDQSQYESEKLTYENPVSTTRVTNVKTAELELSENQKSDFGYFGALGLYPWGPYPLFDYYLNTVPLAVPVSPGFALFDYVHPFYAYRAFDPFWGWGYDDDGGVYDDDHGHDNDDDL